MSKISASRLHSDLNREVERLRYEIATLESQKNEKRHQIELGLKCWEMKETLDVQIADLKKEAESLIRDLPWRKLLVENETKHYDRLCQAHAEALAGIKQYEAWKELMLQAAAKKKTRAKRK